ncbi:hypothetical protein BH23GEM7_BH23GEM7_26430 [soil metagenome]|jgi:hypothetical protein
MESQPWLTPLLRALLGLALLAVLLAGAWWQFVRTRSSDDPFDPGVD